VQKYENGSNHIGAGRLAHVAALLEVPVASFFEGAPLPPGAPARSAAMPTKSDDLRQVLTTPEGVRLVRAFARISDSRLRRRVAYLVTAIATTPYPGR
jgi:transcriptional regulator with XRE-family HTH domain